MLDIIKQSSAIREKFAAGRVQVMGAHYDLAAGKVAWLGLHPAQDSLIAFASQAETDAALARKLASPGAPAKTLQVKKPAVAPLVQTDENSGPSGGTGHR